MTGNKLTSNEIEAANRAEATAILIRGGIRVYRPEADVSGEDPAIRNLDGELLSVQMKGRPMVHWSLYGGHKMWMLFPDPAGVIPRRPWFFIKHDGLFDWFKERHGAAPGRVQRANAHLAEWSERRLTDELRKFLQSFMLRGAAFHQG